MEYRDVLNTALEYYQGNELAATVWVGKYALQKDGIYYESTPNDMYERVASELYRIEKKYPNSITKEKILNYIQDLSKIIPQGSPLFGIGNNLQTVSIGNCYVLDPVYDSYGGIMYSDQQLAQLMKRRAGVGLDISNIRPKGLSVNNAAKTTSGIAGFMERFSNTCREVGQEGRRGAEILVLNVHHPEIETFITIKRDLKKVTGANISVKFTDEFMNAVLNDEEYEQRFPVDSTNPIVKKTIKAKKIWDLFIESAWLSAEPGALFWDTINKKSPSNMYGQVDKHFYNTACNPCLTGDTMIAVADGRGKVPIQQLAEEGKDVLVYALGENKEIVIKTMRNPRITGYNKDVYKVTLDDGNSFKATSNHKIIMSDGVTYTEVKDLKVRDSLHIAIKKEADREEIKPTFYSEYKNVNSKELEYFFTENRKLSETYNFAIDQGYNCKVINEEVFVSKICEECGEEYYIPYAMREISFCSIQCSMKYSVKKELKKQVLTNLKRDEKKLEELKIKQMSAYTKAKFDLGREPKYSEWKKECESSGVSTELKNKFGFYSYENLSKASVNFNHRVASIEYVGKETVYNGTVDDVHNFYFGCFDKINSSTGKNEFIMLNNLQCGEIVMGSDSCRLLAVLTSAFVKNKFEKDAYFDFDELEKSAYDSQKFMDDIIDLEIEKIIAILEKIKQDAEPEYVKQVELNMWQDYLSTCINGRRTGLGTTGIGDSIATLNMTYGSQESLEFVEKVYKTIAIGAYKATIDMAQERGAFPIFDLKIDMDNEFIPQILQELPIEYQNKYKTFGRRNICLLTTAPTGTISLLAKFEEDEKKKYFGVTSGIEPLFIESHIRRKKINPNDKDISVDFIDELGDKWTNFTIYHPPFEYYKNNIEINSESKASPYLKSTANDVDWVQSVKVQAAAQKWIDHSISKTCNLPQDITKEVVSDVYLTAWKSGCKGFTVYRDGSRSGVLIHKDEKPKSNFVQLEAIKRPEKLEAKIHFSNIDKSKWLLMVGLLEGKPYELFGGKIPDDLVISKSLENSILYKKAKGHYDLLSESGEVLICNIGEVLNNSEYNFHTRMLSMSLRHGTPVQYVVEQLARLGDKESGLYTFNKVIARVLKKYIQDGTKRVGANCPNCNSINLHYEEGCLKCLDCGYSKCG